MIEGAKKTGTDRIELYTEGYAKAYAQDRIKYTEGYAKAYAQGNKESAIAPYIKAAQKAKEIGLGINAGHDLDLQNLGFFSKNIPWLDEVSIGHALICDAIYLGLENTIQLYKRQLL